MLAGPLAAEGQRVGKVYRVGYLTVPSRESAQGGANIFQRALTDLGWIEGKNIVLDYRFADSHLDRLPDLAAGLVQLGADVIVAGATAAVAAAKALTQTIPIVMFLPADPVGSGLVASLARPGGNVTGLTTTAGPEIYGKQLQLLKDTFPRISRVAVLVSHAAPAYALVVREIATATRPLGLEGHVMELHNHGDFDNAFAAMTKAHTNDIFIPADSMFYQYRTRLVRLAANTRLPAMWGLREQAEAGGLLAYATDLNDLARR